VWAAVPPVFTRLNDRHGPDTVNSTMAAVKCNNFGATVGQSRQLMQTCGVPRGAAVAKSLSGLVRQSN